MKTVEIKSILKSKGQSIPKGYRRGRIGEKIKTKDYYYFKPYNNTLHKTITGDLCGDRIKTMSSWGGWIFFLKK